MLFDSETPVLTSKLAGIHYAAEIRGVSFLPIGTTGTRHKLIGPTCTGIRRRYLREDGGGMAIRLSLLLSLFFFFFALQGV